MLPILESVISMRDAKHELGNWRAVERLRLNRRAVMLPSACARHAHLADASMRKPASAKIPGLGGRFGKEEIIAFIEFHSRVVPRSGAATARGETGRMPSVIETEGWMKSCCWARRDEVRVYAFHCLGCQPTTPDSFEYSRVLMRS